MSLNNAPDIIKRTREKQIENALAKAEAGKRLTASESKLIDQALASAAADEGYVSSWEALGQSLNVSRRMIQDWRNDARYQDYPRCDSFGRKNVKEWQDFVGRHGLKPMVHLPLQSTPDDGTSPPKLGGTAAEWRARSEKLKGDKIELDLMKKRGTLIVATELEAPIGATLVAITNRVSQMPEILAPLVVAQLDIPEIMDIIRPECETILASLNTGDCVNDVERLVAALPFDAETQRLMSGFNFTGQARIEFKQLVTHVVTTVLRRIGRQTIDAALQTLEQQREMEPEVAPEPEVEDE